MPERAGRAVLFGQALLAHFIALAVVGFYGSIGTTAGFGSGVGVTIYLAWVLSLPWLVALAVVIWRCGGWLIRHPWTLYLAGPPIVCVTSLPVIGAGFLPVVALSAVLSSVALGLIRWVSGTISHLRGTRNRA